MNKYKHSFTLYKQSLNSKFRPIIGLEVHIELSTESKMFCACPANHFSVLPNTQVCPICLGLPGALPAASKKAIESVIMFGLALNCKVAEFSKFDRKHYFYPDLPKSYQISQYDLPLCFAGVWTAPNGKTISIRRVHLEEDTAKLVHETLDGEKVSLVDFNRSGVALMELVTEPDFDSVDEVVDFVKEIQRIVRFLEVSGADMEKGSMRLEANISLVPSGWEKDKLPDYKVELKNINSFRFMKKALMAEIKRQENAWETKEKLVQETRGYSQEKNTTFPQRTKEEAKDYRYFPEPDIPPIVLSKGEVEKLKSSLPELPQEKRLKYRRLGLSSEYIEVLVDDRQTSSYFEKAVELASEVNISVKEIAGVMVNQQMHKGLEPGLLVKKLYELSKKEYSSQDEVIQAVNEVIINNSEAVEKYKDGKIEVIGFLIGAVQKILKGSGDPGKIRNALVEKLESNGN